MDLRWSDRELASRFEGYINDLAGTSDRKARAPKITDFRARH